MGSVGKTAINQQDCLLQYHSFPCFLFSCKWLCKEFWLWCTHQGRLQPERTVDISKQSQRTSALEQWPPCASLIESFTVRSHSTSLTATLQDKHQGPNQINQRKASSATKAQSSIHSHHIKPKVWDSWNHSAFLQPNPSYHKHAKAPKREEIYPRSQKQLQDRNTPGSIYHLVTSYEGHRCLYTLQLRKQHLFVHLAKNQQ